MRSRLEALRWHRIPGLCISLLRICLRHRIELRRRMLVLRWRSLRSHLVHALEASIATLPAKHPAGATSRFCREPYSDDG